MSSLSRRAKNTPRVAERRGNLYWEPSKTLRTLGFENVALGPLGRDALDRADGLNDEADAALEARKRKQARPTTRAGQRTMDHLFRAYLASREFKAKADNTRKHYQRHIEILAADLGDEPIAAMTPKAIKEWFWPVAEVKPRDAFNIFRTLRLVLSWGVSEDWCETNPARDVAVGTPKPRQRIGTRAEVAALIAAAEAMGRPSIALYAIAGVTTMQRVEDILRLQEGHLRGGRVKLKQGKTGKLVNFRQHPALTARLALVDRHQQREREAAEAKGASAGPRPKEIIVSEETGRRYDYFNFSKWWTRARDLAAEGSDELGLAPCPSIAGLDETVEDEHYTGALWASDLRRTGMVWAAQGGARLAGICSISGHEIQHGLNILKTYLPRERLLADRALETLDIENEPEAATVDKIAIEGIG